MNVHFLTSELIELSSASTARGSWVMLQTSTFADGRSHLNAARLTVDFARGVVRWRMSHFRTENLFSRRWMRGTFPPPARAGLSQNSSSPHSTPGTPRPLHKEFIMTSKTDTADQALTLGDRVQADR